MEGVKEHGDRVGERRDKRNERVFKRKKKREGIKRRSDREEGGREFADTLHTA